MAYTPITPFRRPVDAGLLQHIADISASDLPPEGVNKWEVLRELGVARSRIGVTDRELTVLQALLSFHPNTILGGNSDELVVFPSNAAICERLNGMPCSTMRRHLAGLVRAGLLIRRDSPNGKRYKRRYGDAQQAFGFDLTPLLTRYDEVCAAAEAQRADDDTLRRLRQQVSLMCRDLAGLVDYALAEGLSHTLWPTLPPVVADARTALRRKLALHELKEMSAALEGYLDRARAMLTGPKEEMSINDSHFEHHYQNSNTDPHDSELCLETAEAEAVDPDLPHDAAAHPLPSVPLGLVLTACTEFQTFVTDKVRHWHHLVQAADMLRPMMGISPSAWQAAINAMGPEETAVVVVAMLERWSEIKSPGGYLRHLTAKAESGTFSSAPMVLALTRRAAA